MTCLTFDDVDAKLLMARQELRDALSASNTLPLVGDVIEELDGSLRTLTRVWAADNIQTTAAGSLGCCFVGQDGHMSYSGTLMRGPTAEDLERDGTILAPGWFFQHDYVGPHRSVEFKIRVTKWRKKGERIAPRPVIAFPSARTWNYPGGHHLDGAALYLSRRIPNPEMYAFEVSDGGCTHAAFRTDEEVLDWLRRTGLELTAPLGESQALRGYFREAAHMDLDTFQSLRTIGVEEWWGPVNGTDSLWFATVDLDGARTIHACNPNVVGIPRRPSLKAPK